MNYYTSLVVLLVGFKLVLAVVLLGPIAWHAIRKGRCNRIAVLGKINTKLDSRRVSAIEDAHRRRSSLHDGSSSRRSRASVIREMADALAKPAAAKMDWSRVLRSCFLLLLVAYPGVSLKILRLFKVSAPTQ